MDFFNNRLVAYILICAALAVYVLSEVRMFRRDKKYTLIQRMRTNSTIFAQLLIYHLSLAGMVIWSTVFQFDITQKSTAFLGASTIIMVACVVMLTTYNSWHELKRFPKRIVYWKKNRNRVKEKRSGTYQKLLHSIAGNLLSVLFLLLWLSIDLFLIGIALSHI